MKKRILVLLSAVALMMVMMAMTIAPALADAGGGPHGGSCGIGEDFSSELRDDDFNYKKEKIEPKQGAGESSELHPTNCPGSD